MAKKKVLKRINAIIAICVVTIAFFLLLKITHVVADFVSFATTFLFQKSHLSLTSSLLLSAKVLVCCACSLVNALTTATRHYHTFADLRGFNSHRKNPKKLFR